MPRRTDGARRPPRFVRGSRRAQHAAIVPSVALATMAIVGLPAWAAPAATTVGPITVEGLQTEHLENPLGIDAKKPRFRWRLRSDARGVRQSAYEIRVAPTEVALRAGRDLVWRSGRAASDESTERVYDGPALRSGQRCVWQVRVWDGDGKPTAWSAPATFEMGLLDPADWKASWIDPGLPEDVATSGPLPMLRHEFD